MEHLAEMDYLKKIGRNIGKIDDVQFDAYITEAEQMYIKPAIGDALFIALLAPDAESDEKHAMLLNGGAYTDEEGDPYMFKGLRVALAYYVYAQNLLAGDLQSTRFGMVYKDNDYSSRPDARERSDAYNNALEIANNYLAECIDYCKRIGLLRKRMGNARSSGSVRIKKIG